MYTFSRATLTLASGAAAAAVALSGAASASADNGLPVITDTPTAVDPIQTIQGTPAEDGMTPALFDAYQSDLQGSPWFDALQSGDFTGNNGFGTFITWQDEQEITYADDVLVKQGGFDSGELSRNPLFTGEPGEANLATALNDMHSDDMTLLTAVGDHASSGTIFGDEMNVAFTDWFQVNPAISALEGQDFWTDLTNLF